MSFKSTAESDSLRQFDHDSTGKMLTVLIPIGRTFTYISASYPEGSSSNHESFGDDNMYRRVPGDGVARGPGKVDRRSPDPALNPNMLTFWASVAFLRISHTWKMHSDDAYRSYASFWVVFVRVYP